jgi:hypothetical protein
MSCDCRDYECKARCGESAAISMRAARGESLCRCPHPLDFAVQNGKGPTSSNHCFRCGLPLVRDRRFHPDTDPDPEVLACFWGLENIWAGRRPRSLPAYLTADHVNAARFVAWLDRQGLVLRQRDQKKKAEWRSGRRRQIEIWTADRILTGFGRHLSELPDEVFE